MPAALTYVENSSYLPGRTMRAQPALAATIRPGEELRQAVLLRLMEQRQLLDPFGFLVYAELAGAELSPVG
jgi:hypothetical protein